MEEQGEWTEFSSKWSPPKDLPPPSTPRPPPPPPGAWQPSPIAPPPRHPARTPPGYPLYVVYAVLMALTYLAAVVGGFYLLSSDADLSDSRYSPEEVRIRALSLVIVGVPLLLAFAAAPFIPRRPWGWIYGLVLVCIGLTSCCTWPLTIPILLRWIKPEMKGFFGRR